MGPGTYFVGDLSISLSGLMPGIYTLQTDASNPHSSEVASYDGTNTENLPISTSTITIIPEPSTFALLILATVAGVATQRRSAVRFARKGSAPTV